MTGVQAVSLTDDSELEGRVRRFSFSMSALAFMNPWGKIPDETENKDQPIYDTITLEEVSHHDHSNDCWIVLYDRVYEITGFLKQHPGGADVLLEYAGRDATVAFRGTGHTAQTADLLKPFILGQLPLHECIYRKEGGIKLNGIPD